MSREQLKTKVRRTLKEYFDADDYVDISDGSNGNVHVVVISRRFEGKRLKDKNNMIWSVLENALSAQEWGKITLAIGMTPEDIKTLC